LIVWSIKDNLLKKGKETITGQNNAMHRQKEKKLTLQVEEWCFPCGKRESYGLSSIKMSPATVVYTKISSEECVRKKENNRNSPYLDKELIV
jgi:hypothetical protein